MKSSMKSRKYSNGFLPPELYQSHFNSCWSDNLSKRSPQSLYCTFPMKKRPKIFFHFVLRISLLFWNSWQVWPLWAIGRRGKQLRSRNSRLQLQPHQAGKLKFQILEKMKWAQISKYWKQLKGAQIFKYQKKQKGLKYSNLRNNQKGLKYSNIGNNDRGLEFQILETTNCTKALAHCKIWEMVSNECHYCCFLVMMQKRCTKRNKLQKLHLFLRNRLRCPLQHFVCVCIVNRGCDSRSYNDISRDA